MLFKKLQNLRFKSFTENYRYVHIVPLALNIDCTRKVSEAYLDGKPNMHVLEQCVFDDRSIIETLQRQIKGFEKPFIKVSNSKDFIKFLDKLDENSVDSLKKMVGRSISFQELQIHSFLRDELTNNFLPFTYSPVFDTLLKTYGLNYGIRSKFHEHMGIIGTKICHSIELNPEIKSYFVDFSIQITPSLLSIIAGNCLLEGLLYNIDFPSVANFKDNLDGMVHELKLIKKLYEYYGVGVNLLNLDLSSLPSLSNLANNIHPIIESISSSIPSISDCYQSNRLFLKKIPIIGNLLFQVANYCFSSSTFLNIGSFAEQTIDLNIKYTVQTGQLLNIFSDFNYINPNLSNSLPESSGGESPDGEGGNNLNRKIKIVCLFGLVIGVAKFFGNS